MTRAVYVIQSASGMVKVGITGNVRKRLGALQVSSPFKLSLFAAVTSEHGAASRIEALAHEKLASHRLSGEWFSASPEVALLAVTLAAQDLGAEITPWEPEPRPARVPRKPNPEMTALVQRGGEVLYGNQWQTPLAEALGVTDRTMRRWASGRASAPKSVKADLLRVASARLAGIDSVLADLTAISGAK